MSGLSALDLLGLFGHFLVLSLLAIGGAITTAPDMHRYLVLGQHWISDEQFTASVALAQAAPGPNVLFVAVLGWNVAGPVGAAATLAGIMLPSTTLALWATRWGESRRDTLGVRAFTAGRTVLRREFVEVQTPYGPVRMKLGFLGSALANAAPEFEDCAQAAREQGAPIKDVIAAAVATFWSARRGGA